MDIHIKERLSPPFTMEIALALVQLTEDLWNSKDPEKVCMAYTIDCEWRDRTEFIKGRDEIGKLLKMKWEKQLDYRLKKELWGFRNNRMAVRLEYEWHDYNDQWFRSYGNELMEFDESGLIKKRFATSNDMPINNIDMTIQS